MGQRARQSFPYGLYRGAYIFPQVFYKPVYFLRPIYRGPYGNIQDTIWAKWQGKAFHTVPIQGPMFSQRKFINLYISKYQFIGGPMETYRLPYGPNGKAKLSIWPLQGGAYISTKKNLSTCIFLNTNLQGALWKHIGYHMGQMARQSFPYGPYRGAYIFPQDFDKSVYFLTQIYRVSYGNTQVTI